MADVLREIWTQTHKEGEPCEDTGTDGRRRVMMKQTGRSLCKPSNARIAVTPESGTQSVALLTPWFQASMREYICFKPLAQVPLLQRPGHSHRAPEFGAPPPGSPSQRLPGGAGGAEPWRPEDQALRGDAADSCLTLLTLFPSGEQPTELPVPALKLHLETLLTLNCS